MVTELFGLLGYALIAVGAWIVHPALGLLVTGGELVWLSYVNQEPPK